MFYPVWESEPQNGWEYRPISVDEAERETQGQPLSTTQESRVTVVRPACLHGEFWEQRVECWRGGASRVFGVSGRPCEAHVTSWQVVCWMTGANFVILHTHGSKASHHALLHVFCHFSGIDFSVLFYRICRHARFVRTALRSLPWTCHLKVLIVGYCYYYWVRVCLYSTPPHTLLFLSYMGDGVVQHWQGDMAGLFV